MFPRYWLRPLCLPYVAHWFPPLSQPCILQTPSVSLPDRPFWNYRYCPTVFTLVFPPDHFFQSPFSLSNDSLPWTFGIQGSLDGPWNLPHCNQPACNQVTNNVTGGYFQRYRTMEPVVPKMAVDSTALLWRPTWYVGMALHRDGFSFLCIQYISRLDF